MDWMNENNRVIFEETKFAYQSLTDMPTPENLPGPQVSATAIEY